jgi:hypothetical protein
MAPVPKLPKYAIFEVKIVNIFHEFRALQKFIGQNTAKNTVRLAIRGGVRGKVITFGTVRKGALL